MLTNQVADYIFGNNAKEGTVEKVAMTAPVGLEGGAGTKGQRSGEKVAMTAPVGAELQGRWCGLQCTDCCLIMLCVACIFVNVSCVACLFVNVSCVAMYMHRQAVHKQSTSQCL